MRALRIRVSFTLVFVVLIGLAFLRDRGEAQPGTVKQIVPGVWFREGEIKEHGHCNNVIIEMKDYLIVVDANFPSGAKLALEDARKVSTKPVRYVFDTHHHGDHAYGNPIWTKAGATTLAYVGVAEEMKRYEPKAWQGAAKGRKDIAELNLPTAEPPQKTFDKSPFILEDGNRRVEFHFFGWAHTRGDGFVYLPKEQVLATGDATVNGAFNYTAHANLGNWPLVIGKAQKLRVQHVLPGHGVPGGPEMLEGQKQFFTLLYRGVQGAVKQGKKLPDIVTETDGRPTATSIELPTDKVDISRWKGDGFPRQVKDAWEEITQGKPHGEIVGGK